MTEAEKLKYTKINLEPEGREECLEALFRALGVDRGMLRTVCDAYFIVWPPGAVTPFHDHGASEGRIMVVAGKMFGEHYSRKTGEPMGQRDVAGPGKVFNEGPQLIQRMGNSGDTDAVTLHVFFNGPMAMREYTEAEMEKLRKKARAAR